MKFKSQVTLQQENGRYVIKPCDFADNILFDNLIKTGKNYYTCELGTPTNPRTYKQLRTVWKLVDLIWKSQNELPPTENEKNELYEDLKEEYAYKRVSHVNKNKLVPIGMSESNTVEGAFFIQNLIYHLAELCDIKDVYEQTEVRAVINEWYEWQNTLEENPFDNLTEQEYREKHVVSEASGKGGVLHLHHIITRGASKCDSHKAWNWVMLTDEEHRFVHQMGWQKFFERFPHLQGKFERAERLAHRSDKTELTVESLVQECIF